MVGGRDGIMFLVGMKLGIGGNATAPSGNTDSPSWQLEMLMLKIVLFARG